MATLASAFMFRVASECLPLEFQGPHSSCAIVLVEGREALRVHLASRKNAPGGASLVRPCVCHGTPNPNRCPVHAVRRWCAATKRSATGGRLLTMSAQQAGRRLRTFAGLCLMAHAVSATLHGFRRGRAQWLVRSRKPLSVILQAGGWSSAAFLGYLDREEVSEAAFLDLLSEEDEAAEASPPSSEHGAPPEGARAPAPGPGLKPAPRPGSGPLKQVSMRTFLGMG